MQCNSCGKKMKSTPVEVSTVPEDRPMVEGAEYASVRGTVYKCHNCQVALLWTRFNPHPIDYFPDDDAEMDLYSQAIELLDATNPQVDDGWIVEICGERRPHTHDWTPR